jgi:hypothetical protein
VVESAELLPLLRGIRRRVRVLAAADGAARGGAGALLVLTTILAIARARGLFVNAIEATGLVAAGVAGGALWLAARRVPLARCARIADRAMSRGMSGGMSGGASSGGDRVLSALSFVQWSLETGSAPTPLVRAAVADATRRMRALTPAAAAPARRPRGLLALGAAAAAALVVAALPGHSRAARTPVAAAVAPAGEARLRVPLAALEAEREAARAAAEEAAGLGDERLARLARELANAVDALAHEGVARGDALDRLRALEARAAEAAAEAESERAGLKAAGRALADSAATRTPGAALAAEDGAAAARAFEALAARGGQAGAGERDRMARALAAAAAAATAAGPAQPETAAPLGASSLGDGANAGAQQDGGRGQRHLARDGAGQKPSGDGHGARAPSDRKLERLSRDLDQAAIDCRASPELCRRALENRARDLPQMENEALSSEARRRLANAVQQLLERMKRGDLDERGLRRMLSERRFQRAARGQQPGGEESGGSSRGGPGGGDELTLGEDGDADGAGASGATLPMVGGDDDGEGASGAQAAAEGADREGAGMPGAGQGGDQGKGDGIGTGRGGDPLGPRAAATAHAQAHDSEQQLRNGAGPTRPQVIETAATRGFSQRSYEYVFADYQRVVEDALTQGDVPDGRRYIVRRYFQLIRPRTTPAPTQRKP